MPALSHCADGVPGVAFFSGDRVVFSTQVGGDPTLFEYDWDGDGTFDQTSSTAVSSHTFTSLGNFRPQLRITRGSANAEGVSKLLVIGGIAGIAATEGEIVNIPDAYKDERFGGAHVHTPPDATAVGSFPAASRRAASHPTRSSCMMIASTSSGW